MSGAFPRSPLRSSSVATSLAIEHFGCASPATTSSKLGALRSGAPARSQALTRTSSSSCGGNVAGQAGLRRHSLSLMRTPSNEPLDRTLYALGFALFLVAKLSLIRSGRVITFGSRLMRPGYRVLYRLGYALMAAG